MTPVVFLDVDGVLAIREMHRVFRPGANRSTVAKGRRGFSRPAIANLNRLLAATDGQIVVSSSWRMNPECRALLISAGVIGQFHEEWAIDTEGPDRGAEISRWLRDHGDPQYVILDDWQHELSGHAHRLVLTDFRLGFQSRNLARAMDLLRARPSHSSGRP